MFTSKNWIEFRDKLGLLEVKNNIIVTKSNAY